MVYPSQNQGSRFWSSRTCLSQSCADPQVVPHSAKDRDFLYPSFFCLVEQILGASLLAPWAAAALDYTWVCRETGALRGTSVFLCFVAYPWNKCWAVLLLLTFRNVFPSSPKFSDLVVLFHFLLGRIAFNKNKKTPNQRNSLLFHRCLLPAREGENLKGQNCSWIFC